MHIIATHKGQVLITHKGQVLIDARRKLTHGTI